jgi:hypothetical protein
MFRKLLLATAAFSGLVWAADKYNGPRPPKPDVPYLLHADHLIETESTQAREESKKGETTYVIEGASSSAKTPLAEPIFVLDAQQLSPDRIELYRLEVRNGRREVTVSQKRRRGGPRPFHVLVTPLGGHLYKIEADEHLDNGQYSLSPSDSNKAFCFEVY